MQKVKLNQIDYQAADFLDGFEIFQKPSSHIAFYGTRGTQLFVQFNSGVCWLYELKAEQVSMVPNVQSIGVFVSGLKGKTPGQQIESNMVKCIARETVVLKNEVTSGKQIPLGKAKEEVYLVTDGDVCIVENMRTGNRYSTPSANVMRRAAA